MDGPAAGLQGAVSISSDAGMALRARVVWGRRAGVAAAMLSLVLAAALHGSLGGGRTGAAPARSQGLDRHGLLSLPLAAQGPVSAVLGRESAAYRVGISGGEPRAANPAQRLSSSFASGGVSVSSGAARVTLGLRGMGYGSSLHAVGAVAPRAHANRVVYRHPGVSEWYANGPLGLEQGFKIAEAPARHAPGPLKLVIGLAGNTRASLDSGGKDVVFTNAGKAVLRYTGLAARDARGRPLHASMRLEGDRLELLINTRGARYPLRIDPLVRQDSNYSQGGLGAKLTEESTGELGKSVAISASGTMALIGAPSTGGKVGAAYVFVHEFGEWYVQQKLTGGGEVGAGRFGESVALSSDGETALIGGPGDGGKNTGAAWVFTRSGETWTQVAELKAKSGEEVGEGNFGKSVALSADGSTALAGAFDDDSGAGAVWAFTRSGNEWTQQGAKLLPKNGEESGGGDFGLSLALSAEGTTAVVGAPADNANAGAIWMFTRSATTWSQQGTKLTASGEAGKGQLGWSVALSSDGNTALVGARADNGSLGAAFAFTRSGTEWSQQGSKLTASGEAGNAEFGFAVALSANGNTGLIAADGDNSGAGAAWIYTRSGTSWTQQGAKLTGSGESGPAFMGESVALSGDGGTALIGGPRDNSKGGAPGAAWLFEPKLVGGAEESGPGDFGHSVALSSEGNTALVGAPDDNSGKGAVWVFTRSGSTWSQQGAKLIAKAGEEVGEGALGWAVGLSSDGNTAFVGAPYDNSGRGAAWVFTRSGGKWTQQGGKLTGTEEVLGPFGGDFGWNVALSSDSNTALVGGPGDNTSKGAAWVFARSGSTWTQQGGKITGAGESGEAEFGSGVALSSNGSTALVGAPFDAGSGAAWVFTRSGVTWTQQGSKLAGAGAGAVALSADGNTAVAVREDGPVSTFVRVGEAWSQQGERLTIASGGDFDGGIALSASGDSLIVGGEVEAVGAAWAFTRTGSTWTQQGGALKGAGENGEGEEGGFVALSPSGGMALLGYGEEGFHFLGGAWVFVNLPTVTTGAASEPTESSAAVHATVDPNGVPASECMFEYGPTPAYGTSVSCSASPGSGLTPVPVSASLSGLSSNTLYHFRISARNESGTSIGEDETFTTPATSKSKSTGSPSEPATISDGQLTATASGGTGTVTVGHYPANPVSTTPFVSTGDFTDVNVSAGNSFTKLEFKDCELKGGTALWWYSPVIRWEPLSNPPAEYSESPACFTVKITEATTPSLAQMTGTPIAAATPAPRHVGHHEPVEYGRCVTEKKGRFSDPECLHSDEKNEKGKGTFEWYAAGEPEYTCFAKKHGYYTDGSCATLKEKKGQPVEKGKDEAGASKFISTTGTTGLTIENQLGPVVCTGGKLEGEPILEKTAAETFTYTNCQWDNTKCESTVPAEPEGTIKTPELLSVLIEEGGRVLTELKGNPRLSGEPIMEFKCGEHGEHEFKLSGTVTGEARGAEINSMAETIELKFGPTLGKQGNLVLADPVESLPVAGPGVAPVQNTLSASVAIKAEQRPEAESKQEIYVQP